MLTCSRHQYGGQPRPRISLAALPILILLVVGYPLLPARARAATATATDNRFPISFVDAGRHLVKLEQEPRRVVSLVPAATEIMMRIGAGERIVGLTYHSILPPECATKTIVGGFFSPDVEIIRSLHPDLIFYSRIQTEIPRQFKNSGLTLVEIAPDSIEKTFFLIARLGRIFGHTRQAVKIIAEQQRQLDMIATKVAKIPPGQRKRVIRIMGQTRLMVPGDDSFQNEYIRSAGGIAPRFGRRGSAIEISLEEWKKFNPQIIYGCGGNRELLAQLRQPGWNEVDAIKNHRVFFFPCDFTCRLATHCGTFVSWLAARIYEKEFENPANFIHPERVIGSTPLQVGFDYVKRADIVTSEIKDFRNQTLVLTLAEPLRVLSTLEGERSGIDFVANNYFPAPAWGLDHFAGLEGLRRSPLKVLDLKPEETAILFTGARMQGLSISSKSFQ